MEERLERSSRRSGRRTHREQVMRAQAAVEEEAGGRPLDDREYADRFLKRMRAKEVCVVLGDASSLLVKAAVAERFGLTLGEQVIGGTGEDDDYLIYTRGPVKPTVLRDARVFAEGLVRGLHLERESLRAWLDERSDPRLRRPAPRQ